MDEIKIKRIMDPLPIEEGVQLYGWGTITTKTMTMEEYKELFKEQLGEKR